MKWKKEIPNKTEFMKVNSFNFIANEKFNSELEHEMNVGKIGFQGEDFQSFQKEEKSSKLNQEQQRQSIKNETMSEIITLTDSRTDFKGFAPKRYTTKCFIKPVPVPYWYTESLFLKLNSTKRIYSEKVCFKNKFRPFKWSENMTTEVKTGPQYTEIYIPVEETNFHYISLEPQQIAAEKITTDL